VFFFAFLLFPFAFFLSEGCSMSVSAERHEPASTWTSRLQIAAIMFCAFVFVSLTVYYVLFPPPFIDPELSSALSKELSGRKTSAASSKDWPQWRGSNRDGVSSETSLLTTWPENGPRKLWEQPVGRGYSSIAVADGRVYTHMQQGGDEVVACWSTAGEPLWRFSYPASYRNPYGNGPRATPTVDGKHVYTVGGTGIMHCLKTHPASPQGEKVWRKDLLEEFGAGNLQWGVSFSPLVEGNLVYINPGGPAGASCAALDKLTGETRWQALDDQAGYSSPVAATIAGQKQVVFFTAAGLVGLTPDRGELLWRFPWETSYGANVATPIIVGDYIFLSSGYDRGCAVVRIRDGQASKVYENKNMRNHFSSCVFFKDHLYGFNESVLTCLDFRTGQIRWKQGGFKKGSLLIADGKLIVLGEYGKLALAEATPDAYRELTSFEVSTDRCWVVPALADGRLYVRDQGNLMCFDVKERR
jgi:hypothetical protein